MKQPYNEDFERFWKLYPQQVKNRIWHKPGKRLAFEIWLKMSADEKHHAMYSIPKYAKTVQDGQYVAHARTWLSQARYEDWDLPDDGEVLPGTYTNHALKCPELAHKVNINNERNRQMDLLRRN